jgi:hypothetical protein
MLVSRNISSKKNTEAHLLCGTGPHEAPDGRLTVMYRAAFLDISQAFDKVWHTGLPYKLRRSLSLSLSELFSYPKILFT